MVLMQIVSVMCENKIRGYLPLQLFEIPFDFSADVREKAVCKGLDDDVLRLGLL